MRTIQINDPKVNKIPEQIRKSMEGVTEGMAFPDLTDELQQRARNAVSAVVRKPLFFTNPLADILALESLMRYVTKQATRDDKIRLTSRAWLLNTVYPGEFSELGYEVITIICDLLLRYEDDNYTR